jgi:hypothetical protein
VENIDGICPGPTKKPNNGTTFRLVQSACATDRHCARGQAMLRDIIETERQQDADCARIEAAIRLAEGRIAALQVRLLDEAEKRERWHTIRDQTILAVRDVRHNVIKRAIEAKDSKRRLDVVHERGRGATSTGSLPEELTQLAVDGRLARICRSAERADERIAELFFNHGRGC